MHLNFKKMKSIVLLITGLVLISACEKEIVLSKDDSSPRLVVNCMFLSDSSWLINLSESRSLLSEEGLPFVSNGTIKLLNESDAEIGAFEYVSDGNYVLSTPTPAAELVYKLQVDVPGFDRVSASSSAPRLIDIVSVDSTSDFINYSMNLKVNIQDEANVANFYSIKVLVGSYYVDDIEMDTSFYEYGGFTTTEPYVVNGYEDITTNEKYAEEFYFSDELFDGGLIPFKLKASLVNEHEGGYYKVTVKSYSVEAYKYGVSLSKYYEADGDFFAEPVQVISNIENGLGIFGGYSLYSDTIWIE